MNTLLARIVRKNSLTCPIPKRMAKRFVSVVSVMHRRRIYAVVVFNDEPRIHLLAELILPVVVVCEHDNVTTLSAQRSD